MYNYIIGKITETGENIIVVENNGIGYELNVSANCLFKLCNCKEATKILTYLVVREDAQLLYGFYSKEEKAAFLKLITVSGIGPKLAITILSGISAENLAIAIFSGDVTLLNKVKGVGKKTAERIILELRGKVSAESIFDGEDKPHQVGDKIFEEAVLALIALGITKGEAVKACTKNRSKAETVEKLIALSLRNPD